MMSGDVQNSQRDSLQNWLLMRLCHLRDTPPTVQGPETVTLAAYHFYLGETDFDKNFETLESAIRETWRHCGLLKTVLVVNQVTRRLEIFVATFPGWIKVDVCPELVPGNLYTMSVDCINKLHSRIDSEYVLIIQNDGFPIRSGLEAFLGEYDYIGAPWVFGKDDWVTRLLLRHRFDVGNGGFSLRSKRVCETTAWYFQRKYKRMPHCYLMTEDYFICKTLPSFEKRYRETIKIAPPKIAATFSLEANVELHTSINASPFGFHGSAAFELLQRNGKIRIAST